MPNYKCENCGKESNTAIGLYWLSDHPEYFDWAGIEDRKGKRLCGHCAPQRYEDGKPTPYEERQSRYDKMTSTN